MTTKDSPNAKLQAEAGKIASLLKRFEGGDFTSMPVGQAIKLAHARTTGTLSYAIFMDDKIIKIAMPWSVIRDTEEAALAEYVLKQMQETRDAS